jgi:nicotinate-nucleotide pyrophosphorylase (carboxylating)
MTPSLEPVPPLPAVLIEPLVRAALMEDLGRAGDITTASIVPERARARARLAAREPGVVAGIDCALAAFRLLDPAIEVEVECPDGSRVVSGETVAALSGPARGILMAERVALNFLCHLSGIATATASLVDAVRGHPARVTSTRKTLPGLRALEKRAVRVGGGVSHRFGLDDGVLIKDNHIAVVGSIRDAVARARRAAGHMVKIEVEVETMEQVDEAVAAGADAVLLDNMAPKTLERAVRRVGGGAVVEASGRITPETAPEVAATGVDVISSGWITHSAAALDLGLDFEAVRVSGVRGRRRAGARGRSQ